MRAFAGINGPFFPELTVMKNLSASDTLMLTLSIIWTWSFRNSVY